MADLREWARETAPTLTSDAEWRDVEASIVCTDPEAFVGEDDWSSFDARALLAYRDEVAAGLSVDAVALLHLAATKSAPSNFLPYAAAWPEVDGLTERDWCTELTTFGRAVVRALEAS